MAFVEVPVDYGLCPLRTLARPRRILQAVDENPNLGVGVEKPFAAYQGDLPYIFVCYAHADAAIVYPEIQWLVGQGINIWYDEGIPAGKNWRAEIGRSLERANKVLFYVSRSSLSSDHCNREINLALDEGREVVPVYLEELPLTPDLKPTNSTIIKTEPTCTNNFIYSLFMGIFI